MTTTFYFVRHGETDCNRRGIVQGSGDSRLNAMGRRQAERLADRLAEVAFDVIYTSTLNRARETTDLVAGHHPAVPVRVREGLREMDWGVYEGRLEDEVRPSLNAIKAAWRGGDFDRPVEGGESIRDVQRRGLAALEEIVAEHGGETVLVVTHGRFLRVLLASILSSDFGLERMHEIEHANTCVNLVVRRDGRFVQERLNCTAHLDAMGPALTD